MESNNDGPVPVSDKTEDVTAETQERVIRSPTGFRVVMETTMDELVAAISPGDRIHVVMYNDSVVGKTVGTVTVVRASTIDLLGELCKLTDDRFHVAIKKAAWTQVCIQIWGGSPPVETTVELVYEISRAELTEIMESEKDLREKATRDAS